VCPHRRQKALLRKKIPYLLGRLAPFLLIALAFLMDINTSEQNRFDRFLIAAPALAAVTWRVPGTLGVGALAMALSAGLALGRQAPATREVVGTELVLAAVTGAAAWASWVRQRREHELREMTAVAEVGRRVLLRPMPPRLGTVALDLLYASAATRAGIGGDFYEAARAPGGVRLMLGDVQGKGLGAVETSSVLLGCFREAAYRVPDLPTLAERLELSMTRYGHRVPGSDAAERFATVLLAEIPDDRPVVRLLSCGHPAPLLLRPDGTVRNVDLPRPSPPVNLAALRTPDYHVEELPFGPGDRLLLYTDGVSETRDRADVFYPLADRLGQWHRQPGDELLSRLHADLTAYGGGLSDDIAALLATRLPLDADP
jgi:hypothetical protein